MKLTTIAAVAAAGVGLPLPISSFPATAAPPPAATAGAVGTVPTVPPSHLNATVPAVRVEQEHQLINWQPELTLKAATDVGSDSGTESPSTGTFSRHWHSMTEMTLVLTIMVLVPIGVFALCVTLTVLRWRKNKDLQQMQQQDPNQQQTFQDCASLQQQQQLIDRGPCTSCQLIQMGEMACYHGVCPNCGRVPN